MVSSCQLSVANWKLTTDNDLQGAVAQLGEHLVCNQGVTGSIPVSSTKNQLL